MQRYFNKLRYRRRTGEAVSSVATEPVRAVADSSAGGQERTPIADHYVTGAPSAQNALDIFKDEWSSRLPSPFADLAMGSARLFEDDRITWAASEFGGFVGKHLLELGPLEAGHTYMLEQLGAASVLAVESNTRAYLKCLIVKEILELRRARFLCGDFVEYLRLTATRFDLCIASGVLYHMHNPVELIALLSRVCDHLFIWTHYYDEAIFANNTDIVWKITTSASAEYEGFSHTLHQYNYQDARNWAAFCGGSGQVSHWMTRTDILRCLEHYGFTDIRINFDHPHHPNGPSFAVIAMRG